MEFQRFTQLLIEQLKEHYPEGTEYNVNKVIKNNEIEFQALAILDAGENVAPNIYLDEYYYKYKAGMKSLQQIVEEIIKTREDAAVDIDDGFMYSWDDVKDKLFCKLINMEKNQKRLTNIPHKEYLDLAITVRVLNKLDNGGIASAEVDNKMFEKWEISEEELFEHAISNTEILFPTKIENLIKMVLQFTEIPNELEVSFGEEDCPMYVIGNKDGVNGATAILYKKALNELADKLNVDYLYVLPSSVHECIILVGEHDVMKLKTLVQQVNKEVVTQIDYLSNSVYRYNLDTEEMEIVA